MKLKNTITNIGKYIGIGIISGLTIINTTKAQSNTNEYKKTPIEITREGDNIKIPLEQYTKYITKKTNNTKNTLNKKTLGEITLDGYISDALTTEPLQNVEITLYLYDWPTPIDTLETTTNSQGYYSFIITEVDNQKETKNIGIIEYFNGKTKITTNQTKKIKITKYDILGQEIEKITEKEITGTETIDLKLPIGQTITKIEIDNKTYTNIHINDGKNHYIKKGKNIEQITEENYKKLQKTTTLAGIIDLKPPNNQHHRYNAALGYDGYITENTQLDYTLIPRINLEFPIIDPEYTIIDTIKTIRDLIWYASRIEGDWENVHFGRTEWPILIHIDTTNAPNEWKQEIRKVITYYKDSLDIHPDSLIKETPNRIEPSWQNGFSTMNINYTDSTHEYLQGGVYWNMLQILSVRSDSKIGAEIYIDTNKVQTQQIQTIISRALQIYITSGIFPINHQEYLAYTYGLRIGPKNRPNNDEKKWIKIGRNTKEFYANRVQP